MPADFVPVFATLKAVLVKCGRHLAVKTDSPIEYTLVTKTPSPFPQHKGSPLFFGSVRLGKAYVSFHLVPVYMSPALNGEVSPALKERMQGKACFNFKTVPDKESIADLKRLTEASLEEWRAKRWL